MSDDNKDESEQGPGLLHRYDLGVLLFALAIFAGGTLITRTLATPKLIDFAEQGLHLRRPSGWLPAQHPTLQVAGLARTSAGFGTAAPTPPPNSEEGFHVVFQSTRDAKQRIEVLIAPKPEYGNLRGARAVERLGRYGEYYWEASSSDHSIARRDWLRTEFRYAFKASKAGSPQIANAVEYATLQDKRLYVVTLHGSFKTMNDLDRFVAPTLRIEDTDSVEAAR